MVILVKLVLHLLDLDILFEAQTNASTKALNLVQERHPIAFESQKPNELEQRYSTHEKEMTTIIHCL